jgi:hypothetical protein
MTGKFQKLVDFHIQLLPLPEVETHFVFERDGFAALVERRDNDFGGIGTAGLLNEKGVAPLVWRGGSPFFVAKGFEQAATPEQVQRLRAFQADLTTALAER